MPARTGTSEPSPRGGLRLFRGKYTPGSHASKRRDRPHSTSGTAIPHAHALLQSLTSPTDWRRNARLIYYLQHANSLFAPASQPMRVMPDLTAVGSIRINLVFDNHLTTVKPVNVFAGGRSMSSPP